MPEKLPYSNYRLTARLEIQNKPGMFARVIALISNNKAQVTGVDLVESRGHHVIRDVTFDVNNEKHGYRLTSRIEKIRGVKILSVSDQIFLTHLGGKIAIQNKVPLNSRNRLSMLYTPGVGRVSQAIAKHPSAVWNLTIKSNSVAIVTDGSAVLGLGNLGPEAALPVMEGKSMIFKEFAGIDAWPVCLNTQNEEEIIETVARIAPVFGGINLEDISAPRCFHIEERLKEILNIPVMHDDQHGTAVVVLAALKNALKIVNKDIRNSKIVISGLGAAGIACFRMLLAAGARHMVGCNSKGAVLVGDYKHLHNMRRGLYSVVQAQKTPHMTLVEALSSRRSVATRSASA